jgi:hypothetical protein
MPRPKPRFQVEQNHELPGAGSWAVRDSETGHIIAFHFVRVDARRNAQYYNDIYRRKDAKAAPPTR